MELRKRMHDPIAKTGAWLTQGHMRRHLPGNASGFRVIRKAEDCFPSSIDPRIACERCFLAPAATPCACRETAVRRDCFERLLSHQLLDRSYPPHHETH